MARDTHGLPGTGGNIKADKIRANAIKALERQARKGDKLKEEYDYLLFLHSEGALTKRQALRLKYLDGRIL